MILEFSGAPSILTPVDHHIDFSAKRKRHAPRASAVSREVSALSKIMIPSESPWPGMHSNCTQDNSHAQSPFLA